jgi:hypothetical protein
MLMMVLLLAQQPAPAPERFSILLEDSCGAEAQARADARGDVVVCGNNGVTSQRLPLPDERIPNGPVASNPHLSARAALAAEAAPCAARQGGCQVGFGQPIVSAIVGGLVGLVQDATRAKPDKSKRVSIPID